MQAAAGAFWIGSDHAFDLVETYLNFRHDLDMPTAPQEALFTLSADSRYRLWVNGAFVARGPARCWPWAQAMDVLDIAPYLCVGVNQIALQVYSPGYSHFAYVHRGAAGWLGWIALDGAIALVSDQSWRVRRDASWDALVPRISIYGAGIERRDMTRDTDWQTAAPEGWATPRIVAPPESPIWSGLHLRDVPLLPEDVSPLTTPCQTRFGRVATPALPDLHQDLRRAFAACPVAAVPPHMQPGECAIWIFDLGQSWVCLGGATVQATEGARLTISYAEKLRDGAVLLSDPDTYCRMRPSDIFHLRAGSQTAEPFSARGGRYLIFRLEAVAACTPDVQFYARSFRAPLVETALPAQGDAVLDAVAAMCARTIRACLQDGFVDSIWRESSQWLGDVVAEAFALQGISDDARPLMRAIVMAEQGALADGILPSVLPSETHAYVVTDYNFAWIELLEMLRMHPGASDAAGFLADRMPTLARMLARFRQDVAADGLLRAEPGRRLFLDWSGQDRSEPNLTYNLRYLHGLQTAARLATALDRAELAANWAAQAAALRAQIEQTFRNGAGWRESPQAAAAQLPLALLLLTGVVTGHEVTALADQIIARSLDLDDGAPADKLILASPFMHHYVFAALDHIGRPDAIRAIIRARWGRWAMAGQATTWENWNVDFPDGSVCHGFSAHPLGWLKHTQTPKT